jgi:hypothetical protein
VTHRKEYQMKKLVWMWIFTVAIIVLGLAGYAAGKSYQFTGVVKTVQGGTFTVQKSATETWEFSTDSSTKGTPKVGDKVTVQYRMIATDIETKPAAAAPAKKK